MRNIDVILIMAALAIMGASPVKNPFPGQEKLWKSQCLCYKNSFAERKGSMKGKNKACNADCNVTETPCYAPT